MKFRCLDVVDAEPCDDAWRVTFPGGRTEQVSREEFASRFQPEHIFLDWRAGLLPFGKMYDADGNEVRQDVFCADLDSGEFWFHRPVGDGRAVTKGTARPPLVFVPLGEE